MAILPKGFDVIIDMHKRLNQETYTTSEIVKEFTDLNETRGVASGTITRAVEQDLLKRHGYGVYSVNPQYQADNGSSGSSVRKHLKNCVESTVKEIDKNFPASTVITMNQKDSDILKTTINSLQKIIKELS